MSARLQSLILDWMEREWSRPVRLPPEKVAQIIRDITDKPLAPPEWSKLDREIL